MPAFIDMGIPHFIALRRFAFYFLIFKIVLQIEGKTLHRQKDYDLLYGNNRFIVVVWA